MFLKRCLQNFHFVHETNPDCKSLKLDANLSHLHKMIISQSLLYMCPHIFLSMFWT